MVLPSDHPVTKLIIEDLHIGNAHSGQLSLMAKIRQRFWTAKWKTVVRGTFLQCITGSRSQLKFFSQIMSDQPVESNHSLTPESIFAGRCRFTTQDEVLCMLRNERGTYRVN